MSAVIRSISALILLAAASVSPLAADYSVEVTFTRGEIQTIRAWYREHGDAGERGKGRRGLPPGIAKNLARGKALPPGIAKEMLPAALLERLPPPPRGYERIIVDGKVLLVEVATQIIHDVLADAILD